MPANGLQQVEIVAFDEPDQPGVNFAPDTVMTVDVGMLEVLVSELEAIRQRLANDVRPEAIERAHVLQVAAAQGVAVSAGKKADNRFSEALNAYAQEPSGIPANLISLTEQKQKYRGCSLFIELVVAADRKLTHWGCGQ